MNKETLRKTYLEKRITLIPEEFSRRNELLLAGVKKLRGDIAEGPVHIFLPIQKFKEVNTWPIIHWLWAQHIRTVTTITDTKKNELRHVWLAVDTKLQESKWGIPEPVGAEVAEAAACTLVFVPLVVFDLQLNRIGYGKGFYDAFLAGLPARVKRVGLSLSPPLDLIPYAESHDVALDAVIWPGGIAAAHS